MSAKQSIYIYQNFNFLVKNAPFYLILIPSSYFVSRMITSTIPECGLDSTLHEYSSPKHKYGDFKMLIGLAVFLCTSYTCVCGVCVRACVRMHVCVGVSRSRRPANPKSHEFVNNVLYNSQSTPPHHPRLVIRESGGKREKTEEPSLAFLHNLS